MAIERGPPCDMGDGAYDDCTLATGWRPPPGVNGLGASLAYGFAADAGVNGAGVSGL